MNIRIDEAEHGVPITILHLQGNLDGSNHQELISKAHELFVAGMRNLILNMADIHFMSGSGIEALHTIALLLRDGRLPDLENYWGTLENRRDGDTGIQQHFKLVNVQPRVLKTLEISGMAQFFEIFDNLSMAIASF